MYMNKEAVVTKRTLSEKQKTFAEAVVLEGLSKKDAYIKAYASSKMDADKKKSNNNLHAQAWKVGSNPNVKEYMDRLMNDVESKYSWSLDTAASELMTLYNSSKQSRGVTMRDRVLIIQELNKLFHLYELPKNPNDEDDGTLKVEIINNRKEVD